MHGFNECVNGATYSSDMYRLSKRSYSKLNSQDILRDSLYGTNFSRYAYPTKIYGAVAPQSIRLEKVVVEEGQRRGEERKRAIAIGKAVPLS